MDNSTQKSAKPNIRGDYEPMGLYWKRGGRHRSPAQSKLFHETRAAWAALTPEERNVFKKKRAGPTGDGYWTFFQERNHRK